MVSKEDVNVAEEKSSTLSQASTYQYIGFLTAVFVLLLRVNIHFFTIHPPL